MDKANDFGVPVKEKQAGKIYIYVGTGTCGLGAGAGKTVTAINGYIRDKGLNAEVVDVGCIGMCMAEPIMEIKANGKNRLSFAKVTEDKVAGILDDVLAGKIGNEKPIYQYGEAGQAKWDSVPTMYEYPFFKHQKRIVLSNCGIINPDSIEEYVAAGGYKALAKMLGGMTPDEICDTVEKSGLRGRGGGGFTTGKKWKFARASTAEQKYLICNADEGDPGAFMDRAVIEGDPHRLIEGMAIAAYGIGASKAYVYIRAEYPLAIKRIINAIAQAKQYGILGKNILNSGFSLEILIKKGAGAFVCGEETALMNSIEGKRGMPKPRPPHPAVRGLFDKPTIINNVETLANLPDVINLGWEEFSSVGTKTSKGTKVFALSGRVKNTGLIEVAMGTTIRQIVFDIGGGIEKDKKFKGVQIGGPSGGCIPEQHLDIQIDYESLKTVGAMMGSGGMVVMDEGTCMVDLARFFMDFIQKESCGKCIPCREGTRRMLEILNNICSNYHNKTAAQTLQRFKGVMSLRKLAQVIKDTSLCGLGQTAPNPVLSTLRWFPEEYEAHIYERKCPAGVCKELLNYKIDEKKCKGCTLCATKCPVQAIKGAKKAPHYILEDKCIGCGNCVEVCPFKAVKVS
ncbi:MAG TPA: NADH-quinone oxidoreductase subunit F [Phycisphaerales bacterium]|nr:NADH-quinone oxidoreductase subunit F [Phycisphaerales bacterium]